MPHWKKLNSSHRGLETDQLPPGKHWPHGGEKVYSWRLTTFQRLPTSLWACVTGAQSKAQFYLMAWIFTLASLTAWASSTLSLSSRPACKAEGMPAQKKNARCKKNNNWWFYYADVLPLPWRNYIWEKKDPTGILQVRLNPLVANTRKLILICKDLF